ncbi:MAG: hypothetical protein O3C27_00035 [Actinomycetota bacterium]|nr:hypothetical protein [Actinomycetota bacterium]
MTIDQTTDHPRSVTLGLEIEQQVNEVGLRAGAAIDEVFRRVAEDGWHFQSRHGGGPEDIHTYVGQRLEYQASTVIRDQVSNAILSLWVHLRRNCQLEWGSEESLGELFNCLTGIVAELFFQAMPDPFFGDVVEPARAEVAA